MLQQGGRGGTGRASQPRLRPGPAGWAGQGDEGARHLLSLHAARPRLLGQAGRDTVRRVKARGVRPAETGVGGLWRLTEGQCGHVLYAGVVLHVGVEVVNV